MTPPAVDAAVVHAKLRLMRQLLDDFEAVAALDRAALEQDRMLRYAVERILIQLVELAAGVNAHLAAARLGVGAVSYRESFLLAARAGALPQELAERLAPSAGLRDVLVLDDLAVDLDQVVAGVALARTDFRRYVRAVADALPG